MEIRSDNGFVFQLTIQPQSRSGEDDDTWFIATVELGIYHFHAVYNTNVTVGELMELSRIIKSHSPDKTAVFETMEEGIKLDFSFDLSGNTLLSATGKDDNGNTIRCNGTVDYPTRERFSNELDSCLSTLVGW